MALAVAVVYRLAMAFWVGGIALFTFVATPVVFRTQPREVAAKVVGAMFPVYFRYVAIMAAVSLGARLAAGRGFTDVQQSFATVLLAAAIAVSAWQAFALTPRMERVKAKIRSFEPADAHDPARREFGRLHALSMTLNFLVLADGAVLIAASEILWR